MEKEVQLAAQRTHAFVLSYFVYFHSVCFGKGGRECRKNKCDKIKVRRARRTILHLHFDTKLLITVKCQVRSVVLHIQQPVDCHFFFSISYQIAIPLSLSSSCHYHQIRFRYRYRHNKKRMTEKQSVEVCVWWNDESPTNARRSQQQPQQQPQQTNPILRRQNFFWSVHNSPKLRKPLL